MRRRKANIIFNKNGKKHLSSKIALPVPWIKELGFSENNKGAYIEIYDNKIIIRKEKIDMLCITSENGKYNNSRYDYKLKNGILLFSSDWNGEAYIRGLNINLNEWNNNSFKAIHRFEEENIDIEKLEENSPEWDNAVEIIGFVEY